MDAKMRMTQLVSLAQWQEHDPEYLQALREEHGCPDLLQESRRLRRWVRRHPEQAQRLSRSLGQALEVQLHGLPPPRPSDGCLP